MYAMRRFETRGMELYREGLIRGYFHAYIGQEAIASGVCSALRSDDYVTSTHRGHGHAIAQGLDMTRMYAELFGCRDGYSRGLGGSMHISDMEKSFIGENGIVGAGIPVGTGAALGSHVRGDDRISVVLTSDGAANNGVFAETLNLAAIWGLPLVVVIENNRWAVSTPVQQSSREPDLYKRGIGYGITGFSFDGNDVIPVHEAALEAVSLCRNGDGPVLLEAKTYRMCGHHINDPGTYLPEEDLCYWRTRDPLDAAKRAILETNGGDAGEIEAVERMIDEDIERAIASARTSTALTWDEFVSFAEGY